MPQRNLQRFFTGFALLFVFLGAISLKACSAGPTSTAGGPFPTVPGYTFSGEVEGSYLGLAQSNLVQVVALDPQFSFGCFFASSEVVISIVSLEFAHIYVYPPDVEADEIPILCGGGVNIVPDLEEGQFAAGVETLDLTLSGEASQFGNLVIVTLPEPMKSQMTLLESLGYVLMATNNSASGGPLVRASSANSLVALFLDKLGSFIFTGGLFEEMVNGDDVEFRLVQFEDITSLTSIPIEIEGDLGT